MTGSNIGAAINAAHARVEASRKAVVEAAADCGRLLNEAKATVPHGRWGEWVETHCTFSARTAQLYMKLADYLADGDPAKAQRVADLSLREVARVLARGQAKGARPILSREEQKQADDVWQHWTASSPAVRERFARHLHDQGDITDEELGRWVSAAHRDPVQTPEQAGRAAAALIAAHVPPAELQRLAALVATHEMTGPEIADAMTRLKRKAR